MNKCYRVGCQKKGIEQYEDEKSTCYLEPVCKEHQKEYKQNTDMSGQRREIFKSLRCI